MNGSQGGGNCVWTPKQGHQQSECPIGGQCYNLMAE
jgi:hypothetical protein